MKKTGDTAGHELAKVEEKDQNRKKAFEALSIAKGQQTNKKGRFVWNTEKRAYLFQSEI